MSTSSVTTCSTVLHNIVAVSYFLPSFRGSLVIIPRIGVYSSGALAHKQINITGLADCTDATKVDAKTRLHTVTLTAHCPVDPQISAEDVGFILTTVTGDRYVLGAGQHPFPQWQVSHALPGSATDKSGYTLSVECVNPVGLLKLVPE